jgi:hypothetical protein
MAELIWSLGVASLTPPSLLIGYVDGWRGCERRRVVFSNRLDCMLIGDWYSLWLFRLFV